MNGAKAVGIFDLAMVNQLGHGVRRQDNARGHEANLLWYNHCKEDVRQWAPRKEPVHPCSHMSQ